MIKTIGNCTEMPSEISAFTKACSDWESSLNDVYYILDLVHLKAPLKAEKNREGKLFE